MIEEKLPDITDFARVYQGVEPISAPVPVQPTAHYAMGGVPTNLETEVLADARGNVVPGLFAAGEVACVSVHGANRLASTSLLEGLLWGWSAGQHVGRRLESRATVGRSLFSAIPDWEPPGSDNNEDPALIAQDWTTIRTTMWNYVGIARSGPRLSRAADDLRNLYKHLNDFYKRTPLSKPLVDLFHGCWASYVITMAAQRNKHSLGCHSRV